MFGWLAVIQNSFRHVTFRIHLRASLHGIIRVSIKDDDDDAEFDDDGGSTCFHSALPANERTM